MRADTQSYLVILVALWVVAFAVTVVVVRKAWVQSLGLWAVGFGLGLLFLSQGAEVLALALWISSAVVAALFFVFSYLMGAQEPGRDRFRGLAAFAVSGTWLALAWCAFGFKNLGGWGDLRAIEEHRAFGLEVARSYPLEWVIAILGCVWAIVGSGLVVRPETHRSEARAAER